MGSDREIEFRFQYRKLLIITMGIVSLISIIITLALIVGLIIQFPFGTDLLTFIIATPVLIILLLIFVYFFLYARNYRIIFANNKITVVNAFAKIRTFDRENIDNELIQYNVYTTRKTVFREKSGKKLFATEIKTREFDEFICANFSIINR